MESEFRPDIEQEGIVQESVIESAQLVLEAPEPIQEPELIINSAEVGEADIETGEEKNEAEEAEIEPASEPESEAEVESDEEEAEAENSLLEEGFGSLEAQIAYHEFMDASNGLFSGTVEAAQAFTESIDELDEYMSDLSLKRQFAVIIVLFKSIFIVLGIRGKNALVENIAEVVTPDLENPSKTVFGN